MHRRFLIVSTAARGSFKPNPQRQGDEHSRSPRSAVMQTRSIWRRHVMLMQRHGPLNLGFLILTIDVSMMLSFLGCQK